MIIECEKIADALRNELQEYGALLNLFGQQQNAILDRDPDLVLGIADLLESQIETVNRALREREALVRDFASQCNKPSDMPLRDLLSDSPQPVRLLLFALIDEINNLVFRTKRRARQNQMLLSRSVDVAQQILRRLNPGGVIQTYSNKGRSNIAVVGTSVRPIATS
jgi:flagellar biosynthesis/type III secretory pathway chaperone